MKDFNYLDLSRFLRAQDAISKLLCREGNARRLQLCLKLVSSILGNNQRNLQIDTVSLLMGKFINGVMMC